MADRTPDDQWQDDVTLKLMGGDESAITDIRDRWATPIEKSICNRYSALTNADAEDVVSIAIWKFWRWRDQYDQSQGKIQTVLYKIARRIAEEWRSGRRKWQQAVLHEQGFDPEKLNEYLAPVTTSAPSDEPAGKPSPLLSAFAEVFAALPDIQRDLWQAKADADGYELDAKTLAIEMGHKYNDGVPYTAGTVRGYLSRAKDTIMREMKKKGFDLKSLGYIHD